MTEEWILQRARRYGRGEYRALDAGPDRSAVVPFLGIPARLASSLARSAIRVGLARIRRDREAIFTARWTWNLLLGKMKEARLERKAEWTRAADPQQRRRG